MLMKFEVENFKNFKEKLIFDFSKTRDYSYHKNLIKSDLVNKAVIYGKNASGKSNLGFAIFDIVMSLTDNENRSTKHYKNYINASSDLDYASFLYEFLIEGFRIKYHYTKYKQFSLKHEELWIDNTRYVYADYDNKQFEVLFDETRNLVTDGLDNKLSLVKYIKNNSIFKSDSPFLKFYSFINGMLWFRSLRNNNFMGKGSVENLTELFKRENCISDFNEFLNDRGIHEKVDYYMEDGKGKLVFKYKNRDIDFFQIASNGTQALILFYYWYRQIKDSVTFLFVDEFDAFYHYELAEDIIKLVNGIDSCQAIFTSHNTNLISNKIMRPDTYYLLHSNKLINLPNATIKEIREGHNLEKMFINGEFDVQ
jgi:AAA15 family ATPase/GTPase